MCKLDASGAAATAAELTAACLVPVPASCGFSSVLTAARCDVVRGGDGTEMGLIWRARQRREQASISRYDSYVPVVVETAKGIWTRFLHMGIGGRVAWTIAFLLCVALVLLWPILFCLKVDGHISASWVAIWTPLWVLDAAGFLFFAFLVSWGQIPPPPGMEKGWHDPYPVSLRLMELTRWTLLVLFQVFLTMRLDGDIDWSWRHVTSPVIAWACLRLVEHLHGVRRKSLPWGLSMCLLGVPVTLANCLVVVQLVFISERLDGSLDWSWWAVFIPTWIIYALQLFSGVFGKCAAVSLAGLEGTDQVEAEAQRLKDIKGVQFHRTSSHYSFPSIVSLVLAIMVIEGEDLSAFIIFIPQFAIAGVLASLFCFWCLCASRLAKAESEAADEIELEA